MQLVIEFIQGINAQSPLDAVLGAVQQARSGPMRGEMKVHPLLMMHLLKDGQPHSSLRIAQQSDGRYEIAQTDKPFPLGMLFSCADAQQSPGFLPPEFYPDEKAALDAFRAMLFKLAEPNLV